MWRARSRFIRETRKKNSSRIQPLFRAPRPFHLQTHQSRCWFSDTRATIPHFQPSLILFLPRPLLSRYVSSHYHILYVCRVISRVTAENSLTLVDKRSHFLCTSRIYAF